MDDRIDLTEDRDFRNSQGVEIPRSIFRRRSKGFSNLSNTFTYFNLNGNISYQPFMSSSTSSQTGMGMIYKDGTTCDRCGRDITRLPWQQEVYYGLCRRCHRITSVPRVIRIPWK